MQHMICAREQLRCDHVTFQSLRLKLGMPGAECQRQESDALINIFESPVMVPPDHIVLLDLTHNATIKEIRPFLKFSKF